MPLVALAMTFATLVVVANVIAVKLLDVNGWAVPAGVLAYPFTFLVTDTISELYGRKTATKLVWMGFVVSALMVLLVYVAKILPAAGFWEHQEAFETILGSVPRVVLASLTAYLISQHGDVILFHFLPATHQQTPSMAAQHRLHHRLSSRRHRALHIHRVLWNCPRRRPLEPHVYPIPD